MGLRKQFSTWFKFAIVCGGIYAIIGNMDPKDPLACFCFFHVQVTFAAVLVELFAFLHIILIGHKYKIKQTYICLKAGVVANAQCLTYLYDFVTSRYWKHNYPGYNSSNGVSITHLFIPIAIFCDWFMFDLRDQQTWKYIPIWLAFPLTYVIFVFVRMNLGAKFQSPIGALVAPYHYFDYDENGITITVIWMIALSIYWIVGCGLLVAFDHYFREFQKFLKKRRDEALQARTKKKVKEERDGYVKVRAK